MGCKIFRSEELVNDDDGDVDGNGAEGATR